MAKTMPSAKDLRALPAEDLNAQLSKLSQELWQQRLKAKDGSLQQTHRLRLLRRQLARVQTTLRGRQT